MDPWHRFRLLACLAVMLGMLLVGGIGLSFPHPDNLGSEWLRYPMELKPWGVYTRATPFPVLHWYMRKPGNLPVTKSWETPNGEFREFIE